MGFDVSLKAFMFSTPGCLVGFSKVHKESLGVFLFSKYSSAAVVLQAGANDILNTYIFIYFGRLKNFRKRCGNPENAQGKIPKKMVSGAT